MTAGLRVKPIDAVGITELFCGRWHATIRLLPEDAVIFLMHADRVLIVSSSPQLVQRWEPESRMTPRQSQPTSRLLAQIPWPYSPTSNTFFVRPVWPRSPDGTTPDRQGALSRHDPRSRKSASQSSDRAISKLTVITRPGVMSSHCRRGWVRSARASRHRFFRAMGSVRAGAMGSVRAGAMGSVCTRRFSCNGFMLRRRFAQFCAAVVASFSDATGFDFWRDWVCFVGAEATPSTASELRARSVRSCVNFVTVPP